MSRRPVGLLIEDMLDRIERIERFVGDLNREAFLRDQKTIDSVIRNLEVIGEAASRLPEEFRESHANIPWRRIVGLRHRIVHEYFDVDLDIVWTIVGVELPELKTQLLPLRGAPDARGD